MYRYVQMSRSINYKIHFCVRNFLDYSKSGKIYPVSKKKVERHSKIKLLLLLVGCDSLD